jgi:hypothetical protein
MFNVNHLTTRITRKTLKSFVVLFLKKSPKNFKIKNPNVKLIFVIILIILVQKHQSCPNIIVFDCCATNNRTQIF